MKKAGFELSFLHPLPQPYFSLGKPVGLGRPFQREYAGSLGNSVANRDSHDGTPEPVTLWPTVCLAGIKPQDTFQPQHSLKRAAS